jgi:hypothetical protein
MSEKSIIPLTQNESPLKQRVDGLPAPFKDEELEQLFEFFSCIKHIVDRLLSEGYTIRGGKFIPPKEK